MQSQEVDHFEEAIKKIDTELPADFQTEFVRQIADIKKRFPQAQKIVESCIRGVRAKPLTLARALAASYVLNGGVAIRDLDDEDWENRPTPETQVPQSQSEIDSQELEHLLATVDVSGEDWLSGATTPTDESF